MEGKIFISYRRVDEGHAGRLSDRLVEHFGADNVFMDVETIDLGENWKDELDKAITSCDVMVALISPTWLNLEDAHGKRRLDDPEDVLRMEIVTALKDKITVIPIRVGGARMPSTNELPEDLQNLHLYQAMELRHSRYQDDVNKLIVQLEKAIEEAKTRKVQEANFQEWTQLYQRAERYYDEGLLDDALREFTMLVESAGSDFENIQWYLDAINKKKLKQFKDVKDGLYRDGVEKIEAERLEDALKVFERLWEMDPEFRDVKKYIQKVKEKIRYQDDQLMSTLMTELQFTADDLAQNRDGNLSDEQKTMTKKQGYEQFQIALFPLMGIGAWVFAVLNPEYFTLEPYKAQPLYCLFACLGIFFMLLPIFAIIFMVKGYRLITNPIVSDQTDFVGDEGQFVKIGSVRVPGSVKLWADVTRSYQGKFKVYFVSQNETFLSLEMVDEE